MPALASSLDFALERASRLVALSPADATLVSWFEWRHGQASEGARQRRVLDAERREILVRVRVSGRTGAARGDATEPGELQRLLRSALGAARLAAPSPDWEPVAGGRRGGRAARGRRNRRARRGERRAAPGAACRPALGARLALARGAPRRRLELRAGAPDRADRRDFHRAYRPAPRLWLRGAHQRDARRLRHRRDRRARRGARAIDRRGPVSRRGPAPRALPRGGDRPPVALCAARSSRRGGGSSAARPSRPFSRRSWHWSTSREPKIFPVSLSISTAR